MDSTMLGQGGSVPEPTARSVSFRVTLDLKPAEHRALKRWCDQAVVDLDLPDEVPVAAVLRLLGEELMRSTRLARRVRARLLEPDFFLFPNPVPGSDASGVMTPVSLGGGGQEEVLKYLNEAIRLRDQTVAQAHSLWAGAHRRFARQMGDLVEAAMNAHTPMCPTTAEQILHAIQQETVAPEQGVATVTSGNTTLIAEEAPCPEKDVPSQANAPQQPKSSAVPAQAAGPDEPQATSVSPRTRRPGDRARGGHHGRHQHRHSDAATQRAI
ncbi:hypothetical protein KQY30_31360 [Streptomyces sp. GMY02]|uniref:hypothetical protein n=1 Tax=Streptomyces sp. GMY02 TaxID=1333528 RepID=UPI001C2CA382|nr:hypothetical protein [Streptomyces sp. GMY02]QXE38060.1 hypothetical protein KQY30_31360 [Streptomyces sp. GMY02]